MNIPVKRSMFYICAHRYFHTTIRFENNSTSRQLGNAMRKMLGEKMNTAPQKDISVMVKPELFSKGATEGKMSSNSRRSKVLNKVFMRYITDIMATGQYSSEIVGHGIEINRVKIAPNYKILNVFWISNNSKNDETVEKILQKNAGYLKSELSQLRVMGIVPDIHFIKDKHYASFVELENRLSKADFGKNHVPIDPVSKLKSELELFMPLDEQVKEKLQNCEDNNEIQEVPLPLMTHNIFGVNHSNILERVKRSMQKSEALHRQSGTKSEEAKWNYSEGTQTVNENPISLGDEVSQQAAFRRFLRRRRIQKLQAAKKLNENLGYEYLQNEYSERHIAYLNNLDFDKFLEDDDDVCDDIEDIK